MSDDTVGWAKLTKAAPSKDLIERCGKGPTGGLGFLRGALIKACRYDLDGGS
jgi:hypothetical protein